MKKATLNSSNELLAIKLNPFRVLGVYSNTPMKEIVSNYTKIKAFAKTGKVLSFPSDCTSLAGDVLRNIDVVTEAYNSISLPKERIMAGIFWFIKKTESDAIAIKNIEKGDTEAAKDVLLNSNTISSYINLSIISIIEGQYTAALYYYFKVFTSEENRTKLFKIYTDNINIFDEEEFCEEISGMLMVVFGSEKIVDYLHKTNVQIGDDIIDMPELFKDTFLYKYLSRKCEDILANSINELLEPSVSRHDAFANLSAAKKLKEETKIKLQSLRISLGKRSNIYITLCDNVANQIVDFCINYYNNDTNNKQRSQNIIQLLRYAMRTAEGEIAKKRCKENYEQIEKECNPIIINDIKNESKSIKKTDTPIKFELLCPDTLITGKTYQIKYIVNYNGNARFLSPAFRGLKLVGGPIKSYEKRMVNRNGKACYDDITTYTYGIIAENPGIVTINSASIVINGDIFKSNSKEVKVIADKIPNTSTEFSNNDKKKYHKKENKRNVKKSHSRSIWIPISISILVLLGMIKLLTYNGTKPLTENKTANGNTYSKINDETPIIDYSSTKKEIEIPDNSDYYETVEYNTGDQPFLSYYGKGKYDKRTQNSLTIHNGSTTDAVVFLESLEGKKIRHVYIRKNKKYKMSNIPGGNYIIKIMQGNSWNPKKNNGAKAPTGGFMENESMSQSEIYDPFYYPNPSSGKYGSYEVTLYTVQNGNMQTEAISPSDLF